LLAALFWWECVVHWWWLGWEDVATCAANIMQQCLGQISAPEAAISRRTASVPLLRLMHSARPDAG
jgi:hypothetical protein